MITRFRPFVDEVPHLDALIQEMQSMLLPQLFAPQQTLAWARFMSWLLGKEHVELWIEREGDLLISASWVYLYPLKWGRYWLYAARGPIGPVAGASPLLQEVIKAHPQAVWLRWDPLWEEDEAKILLADARPSHASFHPKSTLVLDLKLGELKLLEQMKSKGRYNIRLAFKKGVGVSGWMYDAQGKWVSIDTKDRKTEMSAEDAVATYARLSLTTTARDGFSGHGTEYFHAFLREMPGTSFLLLAEAEGEFIAGGLFTITDGLCTYYYGASSNSQREKMAPYGIQWTAIQYAIRQDCHTYDFLGVATPDSTDPSDLALAGVTDFKTKFGGSILTRGKSWEKILDARWFLGIRLIKSLRPFLSRLRRS